jgi:hypothetical protein
MKNEQKWLEHLAKDADNLRLSDPVAQEAYIIKDAFLRRSLELTFETSTESYKKILDQAQKENLFRNTSVSKNLLDKIYKFLSKPISVTATALATVVLFMGNVYQFTSSDGTDYETLRSVSIKTIVKKEALPLELVSKIEVPLIESGTPFTLIVHSKSKYEFKFTIDKNIQDILKRSNIEVPEAGNISLIIIKM